MLMRIQRANYVTPINGDMRYNDKKDIGFKSIYRAFVVQGGTDVTRKFKIRALKLDDASGIVDEYISKCGKKIGIIFATEHNDFDNMDFDKVSKLAGTTQLGRNFIISNLKSNGNNFGIIDISNDTYIPVII